PRALPRRLGAAGCCGAFPRSLPPTNPRTNVMIAELILTEDDVAEAVAYWLEREHRVRVDATELEPITRGNGHTGFYGFKVDVMDEIKMPLVIAPPRAA